MPISFSISKSSLLAARVQTPLFPGTAVSPGPRKNAKLPLSIAAASNKSILVPDVVSGLHPVENVSVSCLKCDLVRVRGPVTPVLQHPL